MIPPHFPIASLSFDSSKIIYLAKHQTKKVFYYLLKIESSEAELVLTWPLLTCLLNPTLLRKSTLANWHKQSMSASILRMASNLPNSLLDIVRVSVKLEVMHLTRPQKMINFVTPYYPPSAKTNNRSIV